jgi:Tfp pilus assembly protein PilF
MCCDFLLTDPVSGKALHYQTQKLASFSTPSWSALVAVAGVGVLNGQNIGEWVAAKLGQLSVDATLDDLLSVLKSAELDLASVSEVFRRHTFTVGAIVRGRSLVALVSNFQDLSSGNYRAVPGSTLEISIQRPARIRLFAAGSGASSLRPQDRLELEGLARGGASQRKIQAKLREINVRVAGRDRTVSRGCYVASRLSGGTGTAQPYLEAEQAGDFIPPDAKEVFQRTGIDLVPKTDAQGNPQPIRVVQEIFASLDMSDGYFKRELTKRPDDAELWGNYGVFLQCRRRTAQAEAAFRRAEELDPASIRARHRLAAFLGERETTRAEALAIYADLVAAADIPTGLRSDFARLLDQAGDLDRAEIEHAAAASAGDSAKARCRYAWFIWRWRGRVEDAAEIFREISVAVGNDVECLLLMAHFLFRARGNLDAAEQLFLDALSSDPKNLWGLRNYGDLLMIRGNARSALHYYRRANKIISTKDAGLESNEGLALLATGAPVNQATRRFRDAIKSDPSLDAARVHCVLAQYMIGQYENAEQDLSHLLSEQDLSAELALTLNAYGALFGRDDKIRNERKLHVDSMISNGARLPLVHLSILRARFRRGPEAVIIDSWSR